MDKPTTRSSLSSLLSRAQDRLPAVSALPHLARQSAARVDPRQHPETLQLQLVIKSLSGCVSDREALAREEQVFAKQLYTWSKDDPGADVVDTCDRLAWLAFKTSELEQECARRVEASRAVLKDIRNMENDLVPRRRNEKQLANRLATLAKEAAGSTTTKADTRIAEQVAKLREEHGQLAAENETFEASSAVLKRQKLHEAFSLQFQAQRELGEKMALVAGYGELLLQGMETEGVGAAYTGKDRTARVKVELEETLANWTPGPTPTLREKTTDGARLLSRSDTRSFGETHGSQLSQLDIHAPSPSPPSRPAPSHHIPHPPPLATLHSEIVLDTSALAASQRSGGGPPLPPRSSSPTSMPPPLPARVQPPSPAFSGSTQRINLSPTSPVLPSSYPSAAPVAVAVDLPPPGVDANPGLAPAEPTVAETGAPIVGTGGPSSGVLSPRYKATRVSMPGSFDHGAQADHGAAEPESTAAPGGGERLPAYGEGDDEAARAREQAEGILAQEREHKAGGGFA